MQPSEPIIVRVIQEPVKSTTIVDVLLGSLGLVGALAMVLLAPIAASIIQLAISRQREFSADATGAKISGSANALADALERLEAGAKAMPMEVNAAAEIVHGVAQVKSIGIMTACLVTVGSVLRKPKSIIVAT